MTILQAYKNNDLRLVVTKYKDRRSYMLIGTDAKDSVNTINIYLDKEQLDTMLNVSKFERKESVYGAKMFHYRYGTATPENKLKEIFSMIN